MTARGARRQRGMTLIEILVALAIFGAVMGVALSFLRSHARAFARGNEGMDVLQNLRFALNTLERDVRAAGANVPDEQPPLVYAGPDVVAFSADLITNVADDPFAVYYDPHAPTGAVSAMTPAQQTAIATTAVLFPEVAYGGGGVNSPAELITFFFELDPEATRPDAYVLYRRVNDLPPELVARNLLRTDGGPFFEYLRLTAPPSGAPAVTEVPAAALPLFHSVPVHLSVADTGAAAVIDSVRAVRVNVSATNGRAGDAERIRSATRTIRMPNMGMASRRTCGDPPILGALLLASLDVSPTGEPVVHLEWGAAVDEEAGERDVVRYLIWRRPESQADWGDPYLSIPAGNATYLYTDAAVSAGERYMYAVAAQDCTPSLSALAAAGPVEIP